MTACIYLLVCPIVGDVRYVGKTKQTLATRLKQHIREARKLGGGSHRVCWILQILSDGLVPIIQKDVDLPDGADWEVAERERIAHYKSLGCDLVNGTAGGVGLYKPSPRSLQNMRKPHVLSPEGLAVQQANGRAKGILTRGKKRSDECRAAMVIRYTGRLATAETKAKMRAAWKGRVMTDAHKAALAASRKGRKFTTAHIAALTAARRRRASASSPSQLTLPLGEKG